MKSVIKSLPNRRGNLIIFYRAINILHLVLSCSRASLVYAGRSTDWMVFRFQHSLSSGPGDCGSDLGLVVASPACISACSYPRIRSTIRYETAHSVASWGFGDSEPVSPCPCVQTQCIGVFFSCCGKMLLTVSRHADRLQICLVWKGSVASQTLRRNQHLSFSCSPEKCFF